MVLSDPAIIRSRGENCMCITIEKKTSSDPALMWCYDVHDSSYHCFIQPLMDPKIVCRRNKHLTLLEFTPGRALSFLATIVVDWPVKTLIGVEKIFCLW